MNGKALQTKAGATMADVVTLRCYLTDKAAYAGYAEDIKKLGQHLKLTLDPVRCFPYRRG